MTKCMTEWPAKLWNETSLHIVITLFFNNYNKPEQFAATHYFGAVSMNCTRIFSTL